ncbi:MAG: hypothetical protein H7249_13120 [Chitinophagaceae bacterium]|nr:hypothetical protein [Oligoflexus sp.]
MQKSNKSRLVIIVSLLVAFFGWGGWAYFVNSSGYDPGTALRSALAQAIYSTVMTLYMSFAVIFIQRRTREWKFPVFWPPFFTVLHTAPILILVHVVNGTPNILKTVSLPIFVSIFYATVLTRAQTET